MVQDLKARETQVAPALRIRVKTLADMDRGARPRFRRPLPVRSVAGISLGSAIECLRRLASRA